MSSFTVESLLCGTPVITYNLTAVPEVVSRKCGYVVNAGDVKAVSEIIQNLGSFNKADLRSEVLIYSKENMIDSYLSLYERIMER